jgi:hypothetical protein
MLPVIQLIGDTAAQLALLPLAPDYDEALLKCATSGPYSSPWTIIVLSSICHKVKD